MILRRNKKGVLYMGKKIMVVDDSFFVTKIVGEVLKEENFEVIVAHSGDEALNILKVEKPDLILLDMMLPGMTGRETCEKIREDPETEDLKIVFLTSASFSKQGFEELGKLNVIDFIEKKFDNEDIIDFISKVKKIIYE